MLYWVDGQLIGLDVCYVCIVLCVEFDFEVFGGDVGSFQIGVLIGVYVDILYVK